MSDHIDINLLNWEERAAIHAQDTTGAYMLGRFRAGEDSLHAIEAAELGDISGKRVLHLQCHIGRDTLSLARRGATVTGLDFSKTALDIARRLSEETGLKAEFVQGTVDLDDRFHEFGMRGEFVVRGTGSVLVDSLFEIGRTRSGSWQHGGEQSSWR
jgi:2-polyprenyl-3-methyl-5-hydroxy-6-metoxy-1,4-benzoquinol methylase